MISRLERAAARGLMLLVLVSAGFQARADDAGTAAKSGALSGDGAQIYSHICQGCHMPQGQGAAGAGHYPKLAGDRALASWEFVAGTILGGRNGMPSFGLPTTGEPDRFAVQLSDQQVADVVNYVRTHFGNTYKDKVTAAQVGKLPHPNPVSGPGEASNSGAGAGTEHALATVDRLLDTVRRNPVSGGGLRRWGRDSIPQATSSNAGAEHEVLNGVLAGRWQHDAGRAGIRGSAVLVRYRAGTFTEERRSRRL